MRYFQVLRAIELSETEADGPAADQAEDEAPRSRRRRRKRRSSWKRSASRRPTCWSRATSPDPQVQFYSAEALAYLDRREAAEPLGKAAHIPAFRSQALTALSVMRDPAAYDQLRELLAVPSAETRYGASAP